MAFTKEYLPAVLHTQTSANVYLPITANAHMRLFSWLAQEFPDLQAFLRNATFGKDMLTCVTHFVHSPYLLTNSAELNNLEKT